MKVKILSLAILALASMLPVHSFAATKKLAVISTDFTKGTALPAQFSCDADNISPALAWSKVPTTTKSVVVILSDLDAPGGTFFHWGRYNIPPKTTSLVKNAAVGKAKEAKNDFTLNGYYGPCPPEGENHRYTFTVYALNKKISSATSVKKLNSDIKKGFLKSAVVASGSITGTYQTQLSEEDQCYADGGHWSCDIVNGVTTNCICKH